MYRSPLAYQVNFFVSVAIIAVFGIFMTALIVHFIDKNQEFIVAGLDAGSQQP